MEGLADQDCGGGRSDSRRDAWTMLGVHDWETAALNRVEWRSMLKEALIP